MPTTRDRTTPGNAREAVGMSDYETGWYWDLDNQVAVPAAERGNADHMLGPYATRAEAENWKQRAEQRNEDWDSDDEEWESWGDDENE